MKKIWNKFKRIEYLVVSVSLMTTILVGYGLTTTASADTTATASASVTVSAACSLAATNTAPHTAIINPGVYQADIGITTLKATCNDPDGFAIYAIGYTDTTYGKTTLTASINGSPSPSNDIATGVYSAGVTTTSAWSMKLATTTSPTPAYPITLDNGYNAYSVVPTTYTKVAHRNSGTDGGSSATGSTLTTTYAAYIASAQAAGTYNGKVKYTLVHPLSETPKDGPMECTGGKICYSPNANDVVGTMGQQSASNSASVVLLASNFSRSGYGFAGWSDVYDYETNSSAHFYGPQETITTPADVSTNGLSLYAVWVPSAGSLQSNATSVCSGLTTAPTDGTANLASVSALTDQRDNQTYAIAKLADGKCWMIENLRLESTNSDNSTGSLSQGYATSARYGNFSGLASSENALFAKSTVANSIYYSKTQSGTATIDIFGDGSNAGYRIPRYNNLNNQSRASSPTSNSFSYNNTTGGMYSYSNYYNWSAAIANTIYYDGPTSTDAAGETSETVNTSICPTGWRLPYGRNTGNGATTGGFYNLNYKINNNSNVTDSTAAIKIRAFPNNFITSGWFNNAVANYRGISGGWWSSTSATNNTAYTLSISSSNVYPGTNTLNKYYGYSIRCVIDNLQ